MFLMCFNNFIVTKIFYTFAHSNNKTMNYKVFILSVVGSLSLIACKKEKGEAEPLSVTNDVKMLNAIGQQSPD